MRPRAASSAALDEVALDQGALGASARRLRGLNGLQRGLLTVGGVPQKNHAQHRHGLFGGREVGVGTELIAGFPKAGFNLRNVVEGVGGHLCGDRWLYLAVCRGAYGGLRAKVPCS